MFNIRKQLGYDPECVTIEKSILRELMAKAGYHRKDTAAIVAKLGFSDKLEFGSGHYFRYREKAVQEFLKRLANNGVSHT